MKEKIKGIRSAPIFFISHSANDKDAVGLFVKEILRGGLEFKVDDIFVSSIEGHKMSSGDDFVDAIDHGLKKCKIAFIFLSENYKTSEICLNEMGASWILDGCHPIPIIFGDFPYSQVGPLQITKQIERLNSDSSLDNIAQTLRKLGIVKNINLALWSVAKKTFLQQLVTVKVKDPPFKKLTKDEFKELEKKISDSEDAIMKLMSEKKDLEQLIEEMQLEPNISKRKEILLKKTKGKVSFEKMLEEKVEEVTKCSSKLSRTINLIILSNYNELPLPQTSGREEEVDDAIRLGYLDPHDGLRTLERKSFIKKYHNALSEVKKLELNENFCEWYLSEYGEDYDPSSQIFWDEHYDL